MTQTGPDVQPPAQPGQPYQQWGPDQQQQGGNLQHIDDQRGDGWAGHALMPLQDPDGAAGIDQDDDRFSLHIKAGIVIPFIFRRDHAIADKHNVGILHRHIGAGKLRRPVNNVFGEFRGELAFRGREGELGFAALHGNRDGRDGLEIAALIGGGDAQTLQFVRDPLRGGFACDCARASSFEGIIRNRTRSCRNVRAQYVRRGLRMAGIGRAVRRTRKQQGRQRKDGGFHE